MLVIIWLSSSGILGLLMSYVTKNSFILFLLYDSKVYFSNNIRFLGPVLPSQSIINVVTRSWVLNQEAYNLILWSG